MASSSSSTNTAITTPYLARITHDLECLTAQMNHWAAAMHTDHQHLSHALQCRHDADLRHETNKKMHIYHGRTYHHRLEIAYEPIRRANDLAVQQADQSLKSNRARYHQAERRVREKAAEIEVEKNRIRREGRVTSQGEQKH